MNDVKLDALPAPLVAAMNGPKLVEAYYLSERRRFVARHVLPDGRKEELEYDEALGRNLTLAERIAELPPLHREKRSDENVTSRRRTSLTRQPRSCDPSSR